MQLNTMLKTITALVLGATLAQSALAADVKLGVTDLPVGVGDPHPLARAEQGNPHDLAKGHLLEHVHRLEAGGHAVGHVRIEEGRSQQGPLEVRVRITAGEHPHVRSPFG